MRHVTVDGASLVQVDVSLASQRQHIDRFIPSQIHSSPNLSPYIQVSQSVPISPVIGPVNPSLSHTRNDNHLSMIPSSLRLSNNTSLTSSPSTHILAAGLPTPIENNSSTAIMPDHKSNQLCPIDFTSNTILTFIMSEINTIHDVIKLLSTRGIHINENCKFWLYNKPSVITRGAETPSSLQFDFDEGIQNIDLSIAKTKSISHPTTTRRSSAISTMPMHCISLQSALNVQLGSYLYTAAGHTKHKQKQNNINEISLEIHFERNQWKTNLEIAIQKDDIKSVSNIIKSLKTPFWTFEQVAETVGYFGSPSNHYRKHIKGFMIQSIEDAVRFDKVLCLHSIFKAANVIKELENETLSTINRSRTVNCLCYYLGKSLKHQSKQCIKLILCIWLGYICESLEETGIFQRFISVLLKQLHLLKRKMRQSLKKELKGDELKYNSYLNFLSWLSSVIEPSLLSDDLFQSFNDEDLMYCISVGRRKRFDYINDTSKKSLGATDIIGIILDYDGYPKGKSKEICF